MPLVDLALATVDVCDAGAASGVHSTFQQFGAALGVAVTGVVFSGRTHNGYDPADMKTALLAAALVCAAGCALAALAGMFLPASHLARRELAGQEAPAAPSPPSRVPGRTTLRWRACHAEERAQTAGQGHPVADAVQPRRPHLTAFHPDGLQVFASRVCAAQPDLTEVPTAVSRDH